MTNPRLKMEPVIIVGAHSEIIELCELLKREVVGLIQGPEPYNHSKYATLGSDNDAQRLRNEVHQRGDGELLPVRGAGLPHCERREQVRTHSSVCRSAYP